MRVEYVHVIKLSRRDMNAILQMLPGVVESHEEVLEDSITCELNDDFTGSEIWRITFEKRTKKGKRKPSSRKGSRGVK